MTPLEIKKTGKTHSLIKAWGTVIFLFIIGLLICLFMSPRFSISLPLLIFYLVIVFNTFFSIRLFASITPRENIIQNSVDIVLFIIYILLAFSLKNSAHFAFYALLLFIVATIKYALLLETIDHPNLLKRKILIDLSGVLACGLALGGIIFWNELYSTWILTIAFTLANILLFTIWPLYRADHDHEDIVGY